MSEEKDPANTASLALSNSGKTDVEMRRDKKKKLAAFKTFLDNKLEPSPLEDLPARRKLSETEVVEEKLESSQLCKICKQAPSQARLCEFCKDMVCPSHMKKRRRYPQTNKWARICEFCEDKYLMEKHCQNEMKTEESLLTQEAILRNKHTEMGEVLASKRIKLQLLNNKHNQLVEVARKENARLATLQADIEKRTKRLEVGLREDGSLELSLVSLQKSLPPSLQADYEFLQQENARITRDLVRYQKLCIDAVKARSQREKEMYQEYYQWQQTRRQELQASEKKQEECAIY